MSFQASLGVGPECYNCLFGWLFEQEDGRSSNPYTVFCTDGDGLNGQLTITGCWDWPSVTDCGIDATAVANNLASICASPPPASSTTLPTSSSAASSIVPITIIFSTTTPPTPQTSESNTLSQSTLASATAPSSTSQALTAAAKTSTTPSTAPSTTPFISIQTKSAQTLISISTQLSTNSLGSTISILATDITLSTPTYSLLPAYTGSGNLLRGYCTTPFFTLIPGPTVDFYIGVVGCVNGKDDCCPFSVASTHGTTQAQTTAATVGTAGTVTTESFVTITLGATSPSFTSTSGTLANIGQNEVFPTPSQPSKATLDYCPDDYQTIYSFCCPSDYLLWTTMLGGQTPCYSTVSNFLTPPPLPVPTITLTISPLPTSTIINVIYAIAYPVKPSSPTLTPGAKAGVGASTGVFAVVMLFAAVVYFLRRRDRKISSPLNSTGIQSTADTATQQWWNSRGELHHTSLPSPPAGGFYRDSSTIHVNPPPSEPSSGNTNFYPPAMEQRATQRRPVPVPVPVPVQGPEQSVGYPLPPRLEMDSYHTPVNFGLPPGELFGGHIQQRQELQDQNWNP